ncbi:protein adenylyltransferase Fic-like [Tubulanus polymorphus]|uniref:protein adenylyltransferase Fic-like n=1 Tax=Tubulanus polymorphus TaxID=672921 RepID=UPI003DA44171
MTMSVGISVNEYGDQGLVDGEHCGMDHREHGGMDHREHGGMDHREHCSMDHREHCSMDHREHCSMDNREHCSMDNREHGGMDNREHGGMDHREHGGMDHREHGESNGEINTKKRTKSRNNSGRTISTSSNDSSSSPVMNCSSPAAGIINSPMTFLIVFFSGVSIATVVMFVVANLPKFIEFDITYFSDKRRGSNAFAAKAWFGGDLRNDALNEDFFHTTLALKRKTRASKEVTNEALSALNLALDFEMHGKHNKALRLFQHAYSLDPRHVEVLVEYGEYLEEHGDEQNDLLLAAQMYTKAVSVSPQHTRALTNQERILPIVREMDRKTFTRIDAKREQFYNIPENHPGLRRAKRESFFLHIYHTNAIEGNTMSLAQTRAIVETRMAVHGKSILEHNEILGLDDALSYINSTLIRRVGAITVTDLLEIHKRVLGYVDPIEAGRLRNTQVYVGDHTPPSANAILELMREFIEWLNSVESTTDLHPIEHAALAHYKLVFIHPFYDGNGRTSRLLMNLILMQAGFPPVIIKVDEKHEYYQHLQTANDGDIRPFIRFIANCTERTLDEFLMYSSDLALRDLASSATDDGRTIIVDKGQGQQQQWKP